MQSVDIHPSIRQAQADRHRRRPGFWALLLCWIGGR
jgi:hypothetical protein